MPHLLRVVHRPDAVALWLEDLAGATGRDLTVADYAVVGRRLGREDVNSKNGKRRNIPWSEDFLGLFLQTWDDVGWDRIEDDALWSAPLIRDHFPPALRVELLRAAP